MTFRRTPLELSLISDVHEKFRKRCPGKRGYSEMAQDMEEFAKEHKKLIGDHLYALHSKPISIKKVNCALADRTDGGAVPTFREFLGYYAYEEEWPERKEKLKQGSVIKWDSLPMRSENNYEMNLRKRVQRALKEPENIDLDYKTASANEIAVIKKIAPLFKILGPLPWEKIDKKLAINPHALKVITLTAPKLQESVIGFFFLYSLTGECQRLLDEAAITQSDEIEVHHVCGDKEATALYVSIVYALNDHICKIKLIDHFEREISQRLNKFQNIRTLYARPITRDGMRLSDRYGFEPISDASDARRHSVDMLSSRFRRHM